MVGLVTEKTTIIGSFLALVGNMVSWPILVMKNDRAYLIYQNYKSI